MCYYDKKTYDKNGFNIEVYPMLIKPSDGDFSTSAHGLAIQCGADFHVSYQGKFSSKPKLGILQFVRSEIVVGNPPMDPVSKVCIDHGFESSHRLVDYLFGNPGVRIAHQASKFFNMPTAVRGTNRCEIYDIPREPHGFAGQNLKGSPIVIEFWEFVVEISEEYGYIYNNGIKWKLSFAQEPAGKNEYACEVMFNTAKFEDLPYREIFRNNNAVAADSYKLRT